eukprot:1116332-Alexandrium_andersonii.AAC.1
MTKFAGAAQTVTPKLSDIQQLQVQSYVQCGMIVADCHMHCAVHRGTRDHAEPFVHLPAQRVRSHVTHRSASMPE